MMRRDRTYASPKILPQSGIPLCGTKSQIPTKKSFGFTLLEVLIAGAIMAIVVAITGKVFLESVSLLNDAAERSRILEKNLFFLGTLERDIRQAGYISGVSGDQIELYRADFGDTVTWNLSESSAVRLVSDREQTFRTAFESILISPREVPPKTTYILIQAEVTEFGTVERGIGIRSELK